MTGHTVAGTVGSTGVEVLEPSADTASLRAALEIADTATRRDHGPVRKSFVRSDTADNRAPLAQLVGLGGRGGEVPVKLLLALLWRCSRPPFDTDISARKWATVLGLADPNTGGARRVTDALQTLARLDLVQLTARRGEPSLVQLLQEDGSGDPYTLPSTAYTLANADEKERHRYFKVPTPLWTQGHLQAMSMPALSMLLIGLAEEGADGRELWWSTERFPRQYGISPATRAKGTRELIGRRLLYVQKRLVTDSPNRDRTFSRERVRNVYQLINDAVIPKPPPTKASTKSAPMAARSSSRKKAQMPVEVARKFEDAKRRAR